MIDNLLAGGVVSDLRIGRWVGLVFVINTGFCSLLVSAQEETAAKPKVVSRVLVEANDAKNSPRRWGASWVGDDDAEGRTDEVVEEVTDGERTLSLSDEERVRSRKLGDELGVLAEVVERGRGVDEAKVEGPASGGESPARLWPEWVLPARVLDEESEELGIKIEKGLRMAVSGARTRKERAEAVLKWVWSDHGDGSRIVLEPHTAESRNRSVNQVLASRQSACREFNLLYVAALRAVGIPARHCSVGRWLHRDSHHFFAEYWDADQEKWVTVDTSDDKVLVAQSPAERAANGRWNSLVYYAYPGNPDEPDLYGKGRWDKMVRITGDLAEEFPVEIEWPEPERGGTLSAQIWNGRAWRTILIQEVKADEDLVVVRFGKTHVTTRPVLFSADVGGERYLAIVSADPTERRVALEKAEGGRSVAWSPGGGEPAEEVER